jgi:hypothetical protein
MAFPPVYDRDVCDRISVCAWDCLTSNRHRFCRHQGRPAPRAAHRWVQRACRRSLRYRFGRSWPGTTKGGLSARTQHAGTRRGRCGCTAGGAERRGAVKVECSSSMGTPSCTPSSDIFRRCLTLRKLSRLHRATRKRVGMYAVHRPTEISDIFVYRGNRGCCNKQRPIPQGDVEDGRQIYGTMWTMLG